MISVRRAGTLDTRQMAELLNNIIAQGGTTALTTPVTPQDIKDWMQADQSAWHVAEDSSGEILGFQWIEPHVKLPPEATNIATFAQVGKTGMGIGSALFRATEKAAKDMGFDWINAEIRADNEGGLIYYQSRGFEDYSRTKGVKLADGQVVDKIHKRYDL